MPIRTATLRTLSVFSSNFQYQSIKYQSSKTSSASHSNNTFVDKITPFILMYGSAVSLFALGLIVVSYWDGMKPPPKKSSDTIRHHDDDNASCTADCEANKADSLSPR